MEVLSMDKSVEVFQFIPMPVLQLQYLMQLVCFFKDMQLCNVTLHQNSKLESLRLGLTFKIENPQNCTRV